MSGADTVFAGSIPALYDSHLGPALFAPYADDLAQRARAETVRDVLEIAAGTGIVTRALRTALPPHVRIVATDLNEAMIRHAQAHSGAADVAWRRADAMSLPFGDAEFDLVVCQFGAMFFPDRVRAYREARRVLRPGGRFLFNMWTPIEDSEAVLIATQSVAAEFPGDPPSFFTRTPHGHGDPAAARADLHEAGFTAVDVSAVDGRGYAASALDLATGICQGSPLRNEIEERDATRLEQITRTAADALAARFGEGPFETLTRAHVYDARCRL
jgi:SAM-dependent methyltransferase